MIHPLKNFFFEDVPHLTKPLTNQSKVNVHPRKKFLKILIFTDDYGNDGQDKKIVKIKLALNIADGPLALI